MTPEPLTDALIVEATRMNGRESVECAEFLATKSDKDLDDMIRESAHDAALSYKLYDAAIAERHKRREARKGQA